MNSNQKPLKILWAIDAFDDLTDIQNREIQILKTFAAHSKLEVDPTYVLGPVELGVSLEFSVPWTENYAPSAKKTLAQRIKGVDIPGLGEPNVLIEHRPSLKGTVSSLVKYAASKPYDFIVAGSHGRKGFQRAVLGSFAEELILQSKIPVLIVGQKTEAWPKISKDDPLNILLPNDLADPFASFFSNAFDLAGTLGAKVTLLSTLSRPSELVFQSGVYLLSGGWVPVPIYLEKEDQERKEIAAKIITRAKKRHVKCELMIDQVSASVTDSILRHARETKANFIAIAAESGRVASTLLGSVTRQVVRAAPCPVMVFRSES